MGFRGTRRFLVVVLPVFALMLSACDWPEFGLYNHGGRDSADIGISLSNVASTKLDWTATTGGPVLSSPAIVNGIVYVGSNDDNVYALNATTGATLWTATTGHGGVASSPAVANGIVYVGSGDGKVYALNATTGTTLWTVTTGSSVETSPVIVNGIVYVGSNDDKVYALNATTGATLWTTSLSSGTSLFAISSSLAVAYGNVYVTNAVQPNSPGLHLDSTVYALNATTGSLLWSSGVGGGSSSPAIVNGVLYGGSMFATLSGLQVTATGNIYALNPTTGAPMWTATTGNFVESSPAVSHGVVYIGSDDGNLYALNATTGATRWTVPISGRSSPAVANGIVYVGSGDNLIALNATTSATLWTGTTGGAVNSSPAVANGVVYVGSDDGKVYAFKP